MPIRFIAITICTLPLLFGGVVAQASNQGENTTAGSASAFTDDELSQLASGRSVVRVSPDRDGGAAALIVGSIEIDAPRSVVWDIMVDCNRAPDLVPGLKSCEIVEDGPDGRWDIREHRIKFGPIFSDVVNIFRSDYTPNQQIQFHLVGGDLKTQEGAWRLENASADQSRTRVIYNARLAIGQPVPRFLIRRNIRKDMPRVLHALKETAELAAHSAHGR